ncbi:hypothetical protein [Bythopirellula polymerisocia]|uniref:Helix-turn-helix domain-containing protein n=1 Tax=Bythopirellula polymerisocia TaxID=2528003 RepID=A0A5C6CBU5_9BACT|nr:hypothetical protein [Bythopirellula polymerisocia]TWU20911.1 hypothetical protein Pla144_48120 [Bythopirellula polymerisocia]
MANHAILSNAEVGCIRSDAVYSLNHLKEFHNLGAHALREARRNGLLVRKVGRKHFVLGHDWLTYVSEHGKIV